MSKIFIGNLWPIMRGAAVHMKWRKWMTVFSVVALLFVGVHVVYTHFSNEQKKNNLILSVQQCLEEYPDLKSPYVSTVCCYYEDGTHFLLLKNGEVYIAAERTADGSTAYYLDGGTIVETDELLLIPSSEKVHFVTERIRNGLKDYMQDSETSYTYHNTRASVLPVWVSPLDDYYVRVHRSGYEGYMEVISCSGIKYGGFSMHWSIAKSDEDVRLYWAVTEWPLNGNVLVRGWGDLPDEILQLLSSNG